MKCKDCVSWQITKNEADKEHHGEYFGKCKEPQNFGRWIRTSESHGCEYWKDIKNHIPEAGKKVRRKR